jgi:phospholipid/cholesterol/gamma-HCH transport system substrate-binding protein
MRKFARESWVGLFMTVGLGCVDYMSIQLGHLPLGGTDTYALKARFSGIASLRTGNAVTMMGIRIGEVTAVRIDHERGQAVVEFRVRENIKIYSDAIASIKTQGLIGEKYMEIDAGGGGDLLSPGDTITDTESPIDLNEVIRRYAFGSVGEL